MGRKKKIAKAIKSYEKQIEKHKEKIASYEGNNYALVDYWQKEIAAREKQLEREKRKLKKK